MVKCDNEVVVTVLMSGKTKDPYLAACARNIWYIASLDDIDLCYVHVRGEHNRLADMLSRWVGSDSNWKALCAIIPVPLWCKGSIELLELDPEL